MKFLMLPLLTLQLLALEAHAQTPTREDLRKTVIHQAEIGRELAAEVTASNDQLAGAQKQIAALRIVIASATQQIDVANDRVVILNADIAKMTAWGVAQQARADAAARDLAKERAAHNLLRNICGAILGTLLALLVFKFVGPACALVPQYLAIACFAAFAGGFAFVWFFL